MVGTHLIYTVNVPLDTISMAMNKMTSPLNTVNVPLDTMSIPLDAMGMPLNTVSRCPEYAPVCASQKVSGSMLTASGGILKSTEILSILGPIIVCGMPS